MAKYQLFREMYLASKVGCTPETYEGIFSVWERFITDREKLLCPTEHDVFNFIQHLRARPGFPSRSSGLTEFSWVTIHKYITALRGFYRYLHEKSVVPSNPFALQEFNFSKLKKKNLKRPTEMVPLDAVPHLLAAPDPGTKNGVRDLAFMACLFYGGLRASELCGLNIKDVFRTYNDTIILKLRATKAGDDVDHPMPTEANASLLALVEQRRRERAEPFCPLFVVYDGVFGLPRKTAPSRKFFHNLFKHYCQIIGLQGNYSLHSCRSTAITKLLSDGFDHREVREFSRHSSVQMVEVYDKRTFGAENAPQRQMSYFQTSNVIPLDPWKLARK